VILYGILITSIDRKISFLSLIKSHNLNTTNEATAMKIIFSTYKIETYDTDLT